MYECVLTNGLLHKQEAELKVRFDFNKKTAVEKFEKFSKFLVAVSLCTPASDQQERVCVDNRWRPWIRSEFILKSCSNFFWHRDLG